MFVDHTVESAPPGARRAMDAAAKRLGHLPPAVARMATSPELLDGFLKASGLLETSTLDPIVREVLVMTIAARNGCHVCVAMHSAKLQALGAGELVEALAAQRELTDPRLEAMRVFTVEVLAATGDVQGKALEAFLAQGFTQRNALEVVLGIGAYTMSTLANRMTRGAVDRQLIGHRPGQLSDG
jgi:AhpD family alkylhydroperoxidase